MQKNEIKEKGMSKNREKLLKQEILQHMKEFNIIKAESNKDQKQEILKFDIEDNFNHYNNTSTPYKHQKNTNNISNTMKNINDLTGNIINKIVSKKKLINFFGLPNKFSELNNFSKWWKFYDSCIFLCNFLVMILALYDYELNFTYPRTYDDNSNSLRIMMILLSGGAIACVLKRHFNKHKWKNLKLLDHNAIKNRYSEYMDEDEFEEELQFMGIKKLKFFKKGLIFEIFINLIIPWPYLDFIINVSEVDRDLNAYINVQYLLSDYIYILILIRCVYVIRATINYSIFTDNYASSISKVYGIKNNIRFALKCILKTMHIKIVYLFLIASNILLGFALRVFERPYWATKGRLEFEYLSNSLWVIFITMLTIGYGDYVPMTTGGRIICTIAGLWGTFICSLVVVCLYGLLDLSNDQFLVFTKVLKSRVAVEFIENAFKYKKAKSKLSGRNTGAIKEEYDDLFDSYKEFQKMRNESKSVYSSNGLLYYNMKLLKELKKLNNRFDKLEMDIESLTLNDECKDLKLA